jgi:hypothetical protein
MAKQLIKENPILNTPSMREKQKLWLEAKQEGKREGKKEQLSHLLKKRFPGWVTKKLEKATIKKLELWTLRILNANTLEQVFE